MEKTVFSGLVIAWRFAAAPTRISPVLVKPTTEGVVLAPSEFAMTLGSPPSIIATQELVVPKSIPIILLFAIVKSSFTPEYQKTEVRVQRTDFLCFLSSVICFLLRFLRNFDYR